MRPSPSWLLVTLALLVPFGARSQEPYDLILRGGRVLDGSGNPWFRADVAVRGDRIMAIGDLRDARANEEIDASRFVVAPGFIDTHSHAAGGLATPGLSHGRPLLAQGITTVIVNPGGGPVDLEEQTRDLTADGLGVNVARLVPLNTIEQRCGSLARGERLGDHHLAPFGLRAALTVTGYNVLCTSNLTRRVLFFYLKNRSV